MKPAPACRSPCLLGIIRYSALDLQLFLSRFLNVSGAPAWMRTHCEQFRVPNQLKDLTVISGGGMKSGLPGTTERIGRRNNVCRRPKAKGFGAPANGAFGLCQPKGRGVESYLASQTFSLELSPPSG